MKKVTFINGSPKNANSISALLQGMLVPLLDGCETKTFSARCDTPDGDVLEAIRQSDALVFVFPLYVDSFPSHLLEFLVVLEERGFPKNDIRVYGVSNNGFYERKQNSIVLEQLRHWCGKAELAWGQGVGVGAGEMLAFIKNVPLGYGPNKNLGKAFKALAQNISQGSGGENLYVSPNWPRFLWRLQANGMMWLPRARANGLSKKDLFKSPGGGENCSQD